MKNLRFLMLMVMITICSGAYAQFANSRNYSNSRGLSSGEGPQIGYKGFVDAGYAIGTGDWGTDRIVFSTTHGYQVVPYFFIGAGAGINYYCSDGLDELSIPIFADFRGTLDSKISPYIDFKLGYSVGDIIKGLYISPSVGCRIGINEKLAFNAGIGYEAQKVKDASVTLGAISLRIGLDF